MSPVPVAGTWNRLIRCFGAGRLVRTALTSPAVVGIYSVDRVSSLLASPMGRDALAVLESVDAPGLEALSGLAAVNVERNEVMWRMAVMFYISVPVTLALATLQIAPEFVRNLPSWLPLPFWGAVSGLVAFMLYSFVTLWRARQIAAVLALVGLSRAHARAKPQAPPRRPRRRTAPGAA